MTQSQNRSGLSGFVQPLLFTHRFEEELIREKGEAALPPPRLLRPFSACSAFSLLLVAQLPPEPPPPTSDAIRVMALSSRFIPLYLPCPLPGFSFTSVRLLCWAPPLRRPPIANWG